ncbi:DUF2851 family protein [Wenyingzhuangia sp. IMCC45533]
MKESFLHLIWQQKLFTTKSLCTTRHQKLEIDYFGTLNSLCGPDITSAVIKIDGQKWAGNVEIHVNSSDWYAHQHQKDKNYGNVILHVVYHHDIEVYDVNGHEIPVLELKQYIPLSVLENNSRLMNQKSKWIFCEDYFKYVDNFKFEFWLESLMIERLERKTKEVEKTLKDAKGDWEATLFLMMVKYFGGNVNGDILYNVFSKIDYKIIRKQFVNKTSSSFVYGMVGLLVEEKEDAYYIGLQKEFYYQQQKYQLNNSMDKRLNFYGCRPLNFPTIRLAQLIAFYEATPNVFSKILSMNHQLSAYKDLFNVSVAEYWKIHYNFDKESKKSLKRVSKSFQDIIMINVIVPVLFLHNKTKGIDNAYLLDILNELKPEKNSVISKFGELGFQSKSALETQALLTLKKQYCDHERCAECAVGIETIMKTDEGI